MVIGTVGSAPLSVASALVTPEQVMSSIEQSASAHCINSTYSSMAIQSFSETKDRQQYTANKYSQLYSTSVVNTPCMHSLYWTAFSSVKLSALRHSEHSSS